VGMGAVLLKWLPIVQDFDPSDPRCFPFYEALAHHRLPLLAHTGGELTLPHLHRPRAHPRPPIPALKRGPTLIAAPCATRGSPLETGFLSAFVRMCHEYETLYGDPGALNLPSRSYAYDRILSDPLVRSRLVHGSDWPIISMPPWRIGWGKAVRLFM